MKKSILLLAAAFAMAGCVDNGGGSGPTPTGDSPVTINEAYSRGKGSVDPELDWVELYNSSSETVDISGWILSDKVDKSEKITLPAGTTLASKAFLVITVDTPEGFGLSSDGDVVYLYDAEGEAVHFVEFGPMEETVSWSANPDGSNNFRMQAITKGTSNNNAGPAPDPNPDPDPDPVPAGDYDGLVINEVDGNGKFVELYNGGEESVSLEGVKLIKNEETESGDVWWTGGDVELAVGDYYTICEEGGDIAAEVDEATGNGGISAKKNVKFELTAPDDESIDSFARSTTLELDADCTPDYGKTNPAYSFARCPDGTGVFGLAVPSVDAANPATSAGNIETALK